MERPTVTFKVNGDVNHVLNQILFKISLKSINLVILLNDPEMFDQSKSIWIDLYNGKQIQMVFCQSNGRVQLSSDGVTIIVYISNQGLGEGGSCTIKITLDDCKDALKVFLDTYKIIKVRNKTHIVL